MHAYLQSTTLDCHVYAFFTIKIQTDEGHLQNTWKFIFRITFKFLGDHMLRYKYIYIYSLFK